MLGLTQQIRIQFTIYGNVVTFYSLNFMFENLSTTVHKFIQITKFFFKKFNFFLITSSNGRE